jgi:hypothetical protein
MHCLFDCDPHHWTAWGPGEVCTNCGTPALPASTWHRLLVEALKACTARSPWQEGRAA